MNDTRPVIDWQQVQSLPQFSQQLTHDMNEENGIKKGWMK